MSRVARVLGFAVLAAALVFLGFEFAEHWPALRAWRPSQGQVVTLAGLAAIYAASLFLSAEVWHQIVTHWGPEPRQRTYFSFTVSLVGRYVPGNFAHLLGRAFYLRGGGLSDGDLGRATLAELFCYPLAALIVLSGLAPFLPQTMFGDWTWAVRALLFAGPILALVLWALLRKTILPGQPPARDLVFPVLIAAAFLALLAALFATLANLIVPVPFFYTAGAALFAWLVGYATPGAPGGLGAREAALVVAMGGVAPEADLLLAALLFRVTTTAGELACFMAGWPVRRSMHAT
ncbi:MAG: hypothetical protein AAF871_12190 [Pseudomonadota bacterium]